MLRHTSLIATLFCLLLTSCAQKVKHPIHTETTVQKSELPKPIPTDQSGYVNTQKTQVALMVPLTGKHAHIGNALLNAAQMSLYDNGTENFDLIILDTKGDANEAGHLAKEAMSRGVKLIIGPLFGSEAATVRAFSAHHQIPVISFSNDISVAGGYLYTFGFSANNQIHRLFEFINSNKFKRIALIVPDNAYGRQIQKLVDHYCQENAITLSLNIFYHPGSSELGENVANIRNLGVDAIIIPEGGQQLQLIVSSLMYHDIDLQNVKLLGTGQWDTPEIIMNPTLRGAWFVASPFIERQKFESRYSSLYGEAPPRLATLGYDAVSLVSYLIRNQHNFSATQLTQPSGFSGVDGAFRLLPNGTTERALAVYEIGPSGLILIGQSQAEF